MKVIVTSTSGDGHWRPILPIATAMAAAGHEVSVCVPESASERLAGRGMTVHPFPDAQFPAPEQAELLARTEQTGELMHAEHAIGLGFSYYGPSAAWSAMEETFEQVRPDLVLADPGDGCGRTLAPAMGVPVALVHNGQASALSHYEVVMAAGLSRLREERGLPPTPPEPGLIVTRTPASFEHGELGPAGARPTVRYRSGPSSPAPTGPPRVYATLGTAALRTAWGLPALRTIVAGIGLLAPDGVVGTVTTGMALAEPIDAPENVTVQEFAPHDEVIPAASVVVTHGGAGTISDVLTVGRPMIVTPLFADQFHNADAVTAAGIGSSLPGEALTPEALATALRSALDGEHSDAVARLTAEVEGLPTADEVVGRLEGLVG